MTAGLAWLSAFPHAEALQAVRAVRLAWDYWAQKPRKGFHPGINEPKLTRAVLNYVDRTVAPELGLLGFWGTECVENQVDPETGEILNESRTDILYAWNDPTTAMRLVFEFKKLSHRSGTRAHYLGHKGLMRFVTGPYSRQQAVSIMVGILVADAAEALPPLRKALQTPAVLGALRMLQQPDGSWLHEPSVLFPGDIAFDTEHERAPDLAPSHGTIRVAHLFLPFAYSLSAPQRSRRKTTLAELEAD